MAQHGTDRSAPSSRMHRGGLGIPDKLYFRIGEVADICSVPAYVLRFWESEFPQLKPNKGGTGQRLYRQRDVEIALRIRTLLYEEGFTIPGARQILKAEQRQREPQLSLAIVETETSALEDRKALQRLQREMRALLDLLSRPESPGSSRRGVHPIRPAKTHRAVPATPGSSDLFKQGGPFD